MITNHDGNYVISLTPLEGISYTPDELESQLKRDLLDFNLRDIVNEETKPIRELIIAKAFSHGEFDEDPPGEFEDPLGVKWLE